MTDHTPFRDLDDQERAEPASLAPPDPASDAGATASTVETDIARLQAERDEFQDRLLRRTAEFENYRKRIERERQDMAAGAAADLLDELLPVIDNLERALEAKADDESAAAYRRGVELIHTQLLDLIRKRGVVPIETLGVDFDPRWHEAVDQEVSASHRDGEVMAEHRRGYRLGDRLLRPAMVKVARS